MIRYLFVFLLLGTHAFASAQAPPCNLNLHGKIVEGYTDVPLPYAQITCVELQRGVLSDSLGRYSLDGLCPGEYTFVCRHIGCEPITVVLNVRESFNYIFRHHHLPQELGAVDIVAERRGYNAVQGTQRLARKDLDLNQGKSLADLAGIFNGVSILRNGATIGKPVIRGLHSNRVLIMNNGVRQEGQQWGNEHAPEIDPFIANQVILIKGASSVRFGSDAIAGVIQVEPAAIRAAPGLGGRIQMVGITNGRTGVGNAMLEGRFVKWPSWSWRIQGSAKYGGNLHTPDYYLMNTGMREGHYSGTLGYQYGRIQSEIYYSRFQSKPGIFSGAHIGNLTDLQRALEATNPPQNTSFSYDIGRPYQKIDHELLKVLFSLRVHEKANLKWTYARQYNKRLEYDKHVPLNDSLAALNRPALQFELTTHTLETLYEAHPQENQTNTFGLQGIAQANTYEGRFFIPNFRKYGLGAFFIGRRKFDNPKCEGEAGLRYDWMEQEVFLRDDKMILSPAYHYQHVTANLGFIYRRDDDETYRLNFASAWRPPAINEMYSNGLHHGVAAIETGDPLLKSERSYGAEFSAQLKTGKINWQFQPYAQFIDHFIYLKPSSAPVLTIRGAFPAFMYSQTDALLLGHDTRAWIDLTKYLQLDVKASLLRARDLANGKHIVQMPSDAYTFSAVFHTDRLKKLNDVFFKTDLQYRNKQWRVPETDDFAGSPAAYTLLNAQLGFQYPVRNQMIVISLSCDNLLNTSYRDYLNRFRYYSDEIGRSYAIRITIPFELTRIKKHEHQ